MKLGERRGKKGMERKSRKKKRTGGKDKSQDWDYEGKFETSSFHAQGRLLPCWFFMVLENYWYRLSFVCKML